MVHKEDVKVTNFRSKKSGVEKGDLHNATRPEKRAELVVYIIARMF